MNDNYVISKSYYLLLEQLHYSGVLKRIPLEEAQLIMSWMVHFADCNRGIPGESIGYIAQDYGLCSYCAKPTEKFFDENKCMCQSCYDCHK